MIYVRKCFSCVPFYSVILYFSLSATLSLLLFMMWGCVLPSLIYMLLSSFPNSICLRDSLFSLVYSWLLCQKLMDCMCAGLFWGSLFHSTDPYICFCLPILCCFDYSSFAALPEVWEGYAFSFVLFSSLFFGNSGSFVVPYIILRVICSSSMKNIMTYLWEIF